MQIMIFGHRTAWLSIRAALLICLLGLTPAWAGLNSVQYLNQLWQLEDGLPGYVRQVLPTKDGYLWIATTETFLRFDGIRFTAVDLGAYDKDRQYMALSETTDGSIWVSSSVGLARLKNGATTLYTPTNGLPCNYVLTLYQDKKGVIWIGCTNGLAKFENDKFTLFTAKDGFLETSVRSILEDHTGTLWVGTAEGLIEYRDGHTIYHTQPDAIHNAVQCLAETRDGSLWVGTLYGLDRYRNGVCTATYIQKEGELYNCAVRSLYEDREGALWIGTFGGLQRFDHDKFENFTITGDAAADYDSVVPGFIYSIGGDLEGDIWIGGSLGLNRLKPQPFHTVRKEDGLQVRQINSVLQDAKGDIWIGTQGGGLSRIHENQINTWNMRDGLTGNQILALCEDHEGSLWVGTQDAGLNRMENGVVKRQYNTTLYRNLADNTAKVIFEDRRHNLWIGGNNGLSCRKDAYFLPPNLELRGVKTILEDKGGDVWVGGQFGLAKITDAQTKRFGPADNFPPDGVDALCQGNDGTLWIGTEHGQLFCYKNQSLKPCLSPGALLTRILHIFDDEAGQLWITTPNGIFRLDKKQLEASVAPGGKLISSIAYGQIEAMRRVQCNGVAQPAGWKANDGQFWIPTFAGLVSIDPKAIHPATVMPKVIIEQIAVGGQLLPSGPGPALFPPASEVEFTYTAPNLKSPERMLFQCRLDGFDTEWQDMKTKRFIRYAHLPPGHYTFRVRAGTSAGTWTPIGDSFAFTIQPFFYQTAEFLALCLIVTVGSILGFYWLRMRGMKRREFELTRLVEEKTRKLVESQQLILRQERLAAVSQLATGVAHEFNNILTIIQGHAALLMENPKLDEDSVKSLQHICDGVDRTAKLTQQIMAFSRKQIMQQQVLDFNAAVGQIVRVVGRLLGENIRVRCDFADHLPNIEADSSMLEQILINLAVNARDAMPNGGQLTISTKSVSFNAADVLLRPERHAGTFLQLSVTDTGCGMNAAIINRIFEPFFTTKDVGKGPGLGLATVYGLVNQHHGWIEVDSKVDQGTTFHLYFPPTTKPLPAPPVVAARSDIPGGRETILVVEDEPVLRELVREILQSQGYSILEAGNGVEALRIWDKENENIDLLLTDIIMPEGVSGRELATRLKGERPNLPVIFSTGHSREMVEGNSDSGLAAGYLSKPYHPAQLSQVVRECLDAARAAKGVQK